MAKSITQLGPDLFKRIDKIDRALDRDFQRDTLKAAGAVAVEAQEAEMRSDAGGDLFLGRVRSGKGAKIGARVMGFTLDSANIKAVGPVPLLANPTKAHQIPKTGARVRRRREVLAIPGVGPRASANHPGTRGKDTWNRGRDRAEPRVTLIVRKRADLTVVGAFKSGG